ncbi:hypothetical protein [Pseudoruegeria sp. HB172150]|nr:hypothetical protein [Pseudoruegeria sp. HB172150]
MGFLISGGRFTPQVGEDRVDIGSEYLTYEVAAKDDPQIGQIKKDAT